MCLPVKIVSVAGSSPAQLWSRGSVDSRCEIAAGPMRSGDPPSRYRNATLPMVTAKHSPTATEQTVWRTDPHLALSTHWQRICVSGTSGHVPLIPPPYHYFLYRFSPRRIGYLDHLITMVTLITMATWTVPRGKITAIRNYVGNPPQLRHHPAI